MAFEVNCEDTQVPNNNNNEGSLSTHTGDEVVISGISGMFPKSNNVNEFMENLYNKVDMVTAVDPISKLAEMPRYQGVIEGTDKFDALFFKVPFNQAKSYDPMIRNLMEHAYSAIYDSGYNPLEWYGKKMGVFVGSQYTDTVDLFLYESRKTDGFFIIGSSKAMKPNRISYWFNSNAPSYDTDHACIGSLAVLEHAYNSIKSGQCDSAIVGCGNNCILPGLSVNLARAGMLCSDGRTKCFDRNGDGFVRSDSINAIFLQKARDARRIYSEVLYVNTKYGFKEGDEFLSRRKTEDMIQFFEKFYTEIGISPEEVEYVEAHACAKADADAAEMEAIGKFFAKKSPVLIGSVKSNMGNSESASGLCAVTKACLAYHTGKLPGNLHYNEPMDIPSIREGKLKVVQDNVTFKRGLAAVNNFSYTGLDAHLLLKGHFKPKDDKRYSSSIPYLVTVSSRQEEGVEKMLNKLEAQPIDPELIGLLHKIHEKKTVNHMGRGYVILDSNEKGETVRLARSATYYTGDAKTICFVYSGMGSQWAGMGAKLMQIPIFSNAMKKCDKVLRPKGIDLFEIICSTDKTMFDNILNSFIGITAVQIGLTDILKELGIEPDLLIGHSLGEMGCAYADGCFTTEEAILTSYSRGIASIETNFIPGAMAAVGLGYKDLADMVPPEIDIACHNSSESSTISGPAEAVAKFVQELKNNGVFAKEVQTSGISYHSRYTAVAGPKLYSGLKSIILNPKPRSEKWLCTSMPKEKWNDPIAKFSSAEYHVNNLLSPVYFEETCSLIPPNAVIIEIAPHGLLQAILKRSHADSANIALTKRGGSDSVHFLLQAIGKLYENGLDPKISKLYPAVEFPVSTETPLLSHLVEWDHDESWPIFRPAEKKLITTASRDIIMSIYDDDYRFVKNYVRNGLNVLPESYLLVLTWETLAMSMGINYRYLPVVFRNIKFHDELVINPEKVIKISIGITKVGNRFEVCSEGKLFVSGFISCNISLEGRTKKNSDFKNDEKITSQDIYKILHQRGYSYRDEFQSLLLVSINREEGAVKWTQNWTTFIDGLIQLNILANESNGILKPKLIQELAIDVEEHQMYELKKFENSFYLNADVATITNNVTKCGAIKLVNIVFQTTPLPKEDPDVFKTKEFYPYFPSSHFDLYQAFYILLQVIKENLPMGPLDIIKFIPMYDDISLTRIVKDVANRIEVNVEFHSTLMDKKQNTISMENNEKKYKNHDVLIVHDLAEDKEKMAEIHNRLNSNTFVLAIEKSRNINSMLENKYFMVISAIYTSENKVLILMKKLYDFATFGGVEYINVDNYYQFSWVEKLHRDLASNKKVILISKKKHNGVMGIVKYISRNYGNRLSLIKINDETAPMFDPETAIYKEQLEKDLVINILEKDQWGGFYSRPKEQYAAIKNYALTIDIASDLNSFKWCQIPSTKISPTTVQVKVHYAGVSSKDVDKAMGMDKVNNLTFGMDFSGIDIYGNRVMGLLPEGAIALTINADSDLLWPVPNHWTLREAATVPLAYVHAYYCLNERSVLYKGVSVIVTGGTGALGQAIISICLAYGHNVYALVSDNEKKKLLKKLFPELKENQIYNSRDKHSVAMIICDPASKRRSLVINCDSGNLRQELMSCVGAMGYFLNISTKDIKDNENLGMSYLDWDKNYVAVDLSNIFKPENVMQRKKLQCIVAEGIAKGIVKPLSCLEYVPEGISKAFNLISSRKHRGKILVNLRETVDSSKFSLRIKCSSDNSFLVICDNDELGLEVVDRLVQRAAKNVVIHLKKEKLSGYGELKLLSWINKNVNIKLVFDNIETEEGCSNIFNEAVKMGPIEGIFIILYHTKDHNYKQILEDGSYSKKFNRLTSELFNLEATSRQSAQNTLRYFAILTQSPQTIFDEYINSVSEELCRTRNLVGLPGLVFQAKCINKFPSTFENLNTIMRPQNISTICDGLETSLQLKLNNVETFNLKEKLEVLDTEDCQLSVKVDEFNDAVNAETNKTNMIKKFESNQSSKETSLRVKDNFNGGLGAFYTFIDDDLYRATDPFVPMATKLINTFEAQYEELDPNATYSMLIPGFEGHSRIFEKLSLRLKIKAFTIQLCPDMKNNSIQEMAADIFKLLKKRLTLQKKFYLLGYSFGVNIALELTSMLEKEGYVGVVYCLDSSPDVLRTQLESYIGNLSDTQLQDSIIEHMFKLAKGEKISDISEGLKTLNNWDEKTKFLIKSVKDFKNYSHQYLKIILDSAYKRIILARNYKPTFNLNSQLVLIRGIPHPNSKPLSPDYDLSKFSKQSVKVFEIECDTALAPYDSQVPNILNKMLDPELLKTFNNTSSCDVYFV